MRITEIKPIPRSREEIAQLEEQGTKPWKERVGILYGDLIAQNRVDAMVNAANPSLTPGGGLSGAIHRAAGPQLSQFCDELKASLPKGQPAIGKAYTTHGGRLHPVNVIHAIGAKWGSEYDQSRVDQTWAAYEDVMTEAEKHGFRIIAIPLLGSGLYGWPLDKSIQTALSAVINMMEDGLPPHRVVFVTNRQDHYDRLRWWWEKLRNDEELPFT